MNLGELFTKHGSDKNTAHSYAPTYEALFGPMRSRVVSLLELGVSGGASLKAWRDYFPEAIIFGVDTNDAHFAQFNGEERVFTFKADATDAKALAPVLEMRFDIIIDDASHWEQDQIKSWEILRDRLRPGGVYVIEDIQHLATQIKLEELNFKIINLNHQRATFDNVLAVYHTKESS